MLEWIADILNLASMAPFWAPGGAFVISAASILLTWISSVKPWSLGILVASFAVAVLVYVVSHIRGAIAAFAVSLYAFYLLTSTDAVLSIMQPTAYGCIAIDRRHPSDCMDDSARKAGGPPLSTLGNP